MPYLLLLIIGIGVGWYFWAKEPDVSDYDRGWEDGANWVCDHVQSRYAAMHSRLRSDKVC